MRARAFHAGRADVRIRQSIIVCRACVSVSGLIITWYPIAKGLLYRCDCEYLLAGWNPWNRTSSLLYVAAAAAGHTLVSCRHVNHCRNKILRRESMAFLHVRPGYFEYFVVCAQHLHWLTGLTRIGECHYWQIVKRSKPDRPDVSKNSLT